MTATFGYVPGWALEQGLSHGAAHLLVVLCWQGRKTGSSITVGVGRRRLENLVGCGSKSIGRWAAELCRIGVLSVSAKHKSRTVYTIHCSSSGATMTPDGGPSGVMYDTSSADSMTPDDGLNDPSSGVAEAKTGTTTTPRTDTDTDKAQTRTTTTRVMRAGEEPEPTDTQVCLTIGLNDRELDRLREALRRGGESYAPLLTASGSNRNLLANWEGEGKIREQFGWLLAEFEAEAVERAKREREREELRAPPEVLEQRREARAAFLGRMNTRESAHEQP